MSSLSNNLPTPASSYVCPEGKSRTEYYKIGKEHEKIPGQEHIDIAIGSYKKAAEKGETKALVDYARVIINHKPEFIGEAVKALDQFHDTPEALHLLADLYLAGNGVPHDVDKAIGYLMNAHSRGDNMALRRLVSIHLSRNESAKALELLNKASAKDGWACLKLGLLTQGEDEAKAYEYLQKGFKSYRPDMESSSYTFASDPVWTEALQTLFQFQKEKKLTPSTSNLNLIIADFNNGNKDRQALYRLQSFLMSEQSKILNQEDVRLNEGTSALEKDLGRTYYRTQQFEYAVAHFRTGASLGNKDCMYYLGVCLYTGKGCEKNKEKAEQFWREAAKGPDGNFFAREEVNKLDGITEIFEDSELPPLPSTPQDTMIESAEVVQITSDGESVGPLPSLPDNRVTARSELIMKDVEREDRINADRPWYKRAVHWVKGIETSTIKKVSMVALGMILFATLAFGLIKLAMMIPAQASAHPVQQFPRGPADVYLEGVIGVAFKMIGGFFQILGSLK